MTEALLTEHDAAAAWALAYNSHDPSGLVGILAEDVRVMSRWVVNDLVGRDAYLDYLGRKFRTFEIAGSMVRVDVGMTPGGASGSPGRPCAILEQDGTALATVLFDVVGDLVWQISIAAHPPPASCLGSGCYPGFEGVVPTVN